jgi:hypothetical protein
MITLVVFSTFCIGKNQTMTSSASITPTESPSEDEEAYSHWLKNETKYFTIYYPPDVANLETFMAKIRFLLTGIDYTYESYAKAFGKDPKKVELYIYSSEEELKLEYSTNLPWYIEKNRIFTFLDKNSQEIYPYNVESALISYLTGKVNGLTFAFPTISYAYFRTVPQKNVSLNELIKLIDSQDQNEVKEYWDNMKDLVTFLVSKYGVQEVFKLLQSDKPSQEILKLPNVEREYQKFVNWFWNGGIMTGIGRINKIDISLRLNENERFYSAESTLKIDYSIDYFPIFYKMPWLNVENMNVEYFQNFNTVIPFERKDSYSFKYIGNFSIQPMTTDKNFSRTYRTKVVDSNFTLLFNFWLTPFLPINKLIQNGEINVESQKPVIASEFPTKDILVITGNLKKLTGYVNETKVNFYYTPAIKTPARTFKDVLEAVKASKEYFVYPKEINIVYSAELGNLWLVLSSSNVLALNYHKSLSLYNILWRIYSIFYERIEVEPKDLWIGGIDSIWASIPASYFKKFSEYLEYQKRMYETSLKEFPETDHPVIELYKYRYSGNVIDIATTIYKAYLTTFLLYSQAGEQAYKETFREFSEKYLYREADFDEFARILAKKSNNPNILLIWQTWTTKKALPNITIENAQLIKRDGNYTLRFTLVDKNGFAFPFTIKGTTWQGKKTEMKGFYTGNPLEVELTFPGEPKEIIIYGAPMLGKNFKIEINGTKIQITIPS